jgi:hypothetical protein
VSLRAPGECVDAIAARAGEIDLKCAGLMGRLSAALGRLADVGEDLAADDRGIASGGPEWLASRLVGRLD